MQEKDSRINDWWKKESAFFRQRMLRKMCGCKAAEKKKIEKHAKSQDANYFCQKEIIFNKS